MKIKKRSRLQHVNSMAQHVCNFRMHKVPIGSLPPELQTVETTYYLKKYNEAVKNAQFAIRNAYKEHKQRINNADNNTK